MVVLREDVFQSLSSSILTLWRSGVRMGRDRCRERTEGVCCFVNVGTVVFELSSDRSMNTVAMIKSSLMIRECGKGAINLSVFAFLVCTILFTKSKVSSGAHLRAIVVESNPSPCIGHWTCSLSLPVLNPIGHLMGRCCVRPRFNIVNPFLPSTHKHCMPNPYLCSPRISTSFIF